MYKQFATLLKGHLTKFHQILPKSYQISQHNRCILLQLGNFIKILITGNNLLWYKSIHIIYRSFQDVFGVQNCKIMHFSANAKIYLFCKLNLYTMNLKRPVKFKFHKSTIATHNTIADSQHREIITFLTFHSSVVLTLLTLSHNSFHFGSN